MNRYFVAMYDEATMLDLSFGRNLFGLTVRHHGVNNVDPPAIAFFSSVDHQRRACEYLTTKNPAKFFVMGEVTTGMMAPAGPTIQYRVEDAGVLPA